MIIPFLNFEPIHNKIKTEIVDSFSDFYDSYWYVLGENLKQFEKNYAIHNQIKYCVGVSNGLDALILSLRALGIKEGDEVLVPSNTYIATVLAITNVGATPIFVEPDILTQNIDPQLIEAKITKKTKAIMPVHLFGQSCQMEHIMNIAKNYKLKVVEDNAQSHLSLHKGRQTGTWGDINATSFYPGKNLGALGDGGAITTNDSVLANKVLILRNYGSAKKYENEIIGYNNRLDEIQAAFLNVKLQYLNEWTLQRQQIASWYIQKLKHCDAITLPSIISDTTHSFHLFVIRYEKRETLQKYLQDNGISTLIHYPIPPHLQKAYLNLGYKKGDFPIAEILANTNLSLPLWPGMTEEQVTFVCNKIVECINNQ